ncbi:MAG: hypothetical protein ACRDGS_02060, partial [Chloroflexota bacterium]
LYGDTANLTAAFSHSLHHDLPAALRQAFAAAGALLRTLLTAPQPHEWPLFAPSHGGLLSAPTAILGSVGIAYLLLSLPRWPAPLILSCLLIPLVPAVMVTPDFLNSYRISGILPAFFLAIALVLDRLIPLSRTLGRPAIAAVSVCALLIASLGLDIRTTADQLSSCRSVSGTPSLLGKEGAQGAFLAQLVNSLGPNQTVFVIIHRSGHWLDPVLDWQWLYRVPLPAVYADGPQGSNPADWAVLSPRRSAGGPARFWPPPRERGPFSITYVTIDPETRWFGPWLRQLVPGGHGEVVQPSICPTFTLAAYTLPRR